MTASRLREAGTRLPTWLLNNLSPRNRAFGYRRVVTLIASHQYQTVGAGVPVLGLVPRSLGNGAASAFLETIPDFDHARSASSTAVSSKSPQNANRIRLSGRRGANATPAEIAAIPPSASGNPATQST